MLADKAEAVAPGGAATDDEGYSAEADIHRLRAEPFLERKAQSMAFRGSVARELEKVGAVYRRDHCEDGVAADFLVKRADGTRVVLECRFNTQRDFERAIATAEVLRARLRCAAAWIVVPFDAGDLAAMAAGTGAEVVALGELGG
ncbi:MAG: hypothetical protein JJT96_18045, partial [Opitutales bacterium]|nr:hypothetical protein [Opitutales bacterium]